MNTNGTISWNLVIFGFEPLCYTFGFDTSPTTKNWGRKIRAFQEECSRRWSCSIFVKAVFEMEVSEVWIGGKEGQEKAEDQEHHNDSLHYIDKYLQKI